MHEIVIPNALAVMNVIVANVTAHYVNAVKIVVLVVLKNLILNKEKWKFVYAIKKREK